MVERERVAYLSSGSVTVQRIGPGKLALTGEMRLAHGFEVYRELPDGPHYLVSFVNVRGFRAEMRLALQDGRVVVSELHVTAESGQPPPGGIMSRLLRYIPVHAHVQAFAEALQHESKREYLEATLLDAGLQEMLSASPTPAPESSPIAPRRGRRPVAEGTLLDVAAAYANAVKARSAQPTRDAAAALGMEMVRARDYVHRARARGFLLRAAQGQVPRPGSSVLTPLARRMLKRRARKTPRRKTR